MFGRPQQPKVVAEGVVQLGTDLVNWFLVDSADGVVVVDTGLPAYGRAFRTGLAALGRTPADVTAIVATHAHGDHTGGAEALRAELGVPVHVHEAEADAARTAAAVGKTGGSQLPYLRHPHALRLLAHFREAGPPAPIQEVTPFADGDSLPGGLRAVRTDGHTPGHCVLLLEERGLLFAGDHLCTRNPLTGGRGPQILPRPLNISSAAMLDSLPRLEHLPAQTVLVGHGEPWQDGVAAAVERARDAGIT